MIGVDDQSDESDDEMDTAEEQAVAPSPTGSDSDGVEEATDLLKTVRANLQTRYTDLYVLFTKANTDKKKKQVAARARDWLLFVGWLGVGELYVDTLVPMRTDLETARFGHELKEDSHGDLWFTAPRETGCRKTGKSIRWNITKHSSAVSTILQAPLHHFAYAENPIDPMSDWTCTQLCEFEYDTVLCADAWVLLGRLKLVHEIGTVMMIT
jgi:hypothetical protein